MIKGVPKSERCLKVEHRQYLEYWRAAANSRKQDKVPDELMASKVLDELLGQHSNFERGLDVGAGFGRLYYQISHRVTHLTAVEPDVQGIIQCRSAGYDIVLKGSAEQIPVPPSSADLVVCWGVFDMVDQSPALSEFGRVLSNGGSLILTGKNTKYFRDDFLAISAERLALRNGFVQHFVDVPELLSCAKSDGLILSQALVFRRRGDFANGKFEVIKPEDLGDSAPFYEFALRFIRGRASDPVDSRKFSHRYSLVLEEAGKEDGLGSYLGF